MKEKKRGFIDTKEYQKEKKEIVEFLASRGLTIMETMVILGEIYNSMEIYKHSGLNNFIKDGETKQKKPSYV